MKAMNNMGSTPLIYTNEEENLGQQYFLSGFFGFLFLAFIGLGIFLGVYSGEWWVFYFLGPIALLLGILAYGFFPKQKEAFYRMTVYDDRLIQEWKKTGDPKIYEREILFEDVSDCLIGIVSRKISALDEEDLYRYHGLILLQHKDGPFKQEILSSKELYEWRRRLFDKVDQIRFATEDLTEALKSGDDFSKVSTSKENEISHFIGKENVRPFMKSLIK